MIFSIPIFVEERPAGLLSSFIVRPLFQPSPVHRADKLSRALNRLTSELHQVLHDLGREPRHDPLAQWTFHPVLEETTIDLRLELPSGSHLKRFFLVGYPALDRKLFFTPTVPQLHFELLPGQKLTDRATDVFTRYFRELEKDDIETDWEEIAVQGKARLTTVEITVNPAALAKKPAPPKRAFLFGSPEKKDGEQELRKTGRLLNRLYPDDLDRAIGREREVGELARLLASTDRRPILLVGRRKVGKTAVLHELVWQIRARKKERFGGGREVWLLSPMRLISGMSHVGEWENRALAILDYARDKDRVLYFDDLPGLFTAGISSSSNLNLAQVFRPVLEKRSVRLVAEITPESWRLLRERDRAFADLFHVIPVEEPSESETLRVLVGIVCQLEEQHRCQFGLEVVPAVYDLHRRFAREAAFPGKAAGFLKRLAVRHAAKPVGRKAALDEFHEQSGLQLAFLDGRERLSRTSILEGLCAGLAGQDHVLQAFTDILVTLKARLNDPRRPLGTLLLLGPTGVGKTQSAKVLARYLFGSDERLLRFDMNEFVEGVSTGRLTGSMQEAEGLLTGAIRRQPFCVVLFDEIEKAAPEVFDLLLAVLDEGRLTDSLGRVADFTNAVILMTSNLGAREARSRLGFGADGGGQAAEDLCYIAAAEKFFRPEFFNRIDRILPFAPLESAELEAIARQLIDGVFARDGLRRRECLLKVEPGAMARLVELGRNPQLGARALKRVIEREVAQPLAERLAALPAGTPSMVDFGTNGDRFEFRMQELKLADRTILWPETVAQADVDRIEHALDAHAPGGKLELGNLGPKVARYFACREQWGKVNSLIQNVECVRPVRAGRHAPVHMPKVKPVKIVVRQSYSGNPRLDRLKDSVALQVDLGDWEAAELAEVAESPMVGLACELALLKAMTREPWEDRPLVLVIESLDPHDTAAAAGLAKCYQDFVNGLWGGSAAVLAGLTVQALYLEGCNLRELLPLGNRPILVRRTDGGLGVLVARVLEPASREEAKLAAAASLGQPLQAGELVWHRITEGKTIADFRTGLVIPAEPSPEEFRAFMLSSLALPWEVL